MNPARLPVTVSGRPQWHSDRLRTHIRPISRASQSPRFTDALVTSVESTDGFELESGRPTSAVRLIDTMPTLT